MSSSSSRFLAPVIPGGLLMNAPNELTPDEALILQGLASLTYHDGDIIYWNSGQFRNLGIGAPGKVLTVSGSNLPSWVTPGSGLSFETPSGAVDSSNVSYTVTAVPKIIFTEVGSTVLGIGFTFDGVNTIVMNIAPGQFIRSIY